MKETYYLENIHDIFNDSGKYNEKVNDKNENPLCKIFNQNVQAHT